MRSAIIATAMLLGLSGAAGAQDPATCPDGQIAAAGQCVPLAEATAQIDAIIRSAMADQKLKAVLAGAAVDGQPLLLNAWGVSMTGVPATPDMHFRSGSVAIAYLGTLLLQLAEQGVLGLDGPLSNWFPDYPKAEQVTLRMLINGTSGYADYVPDESFIKQLYDAPFRAWHPDELIAIGLSRPMVCDPGTCFSYAHTNFVILGAVMEKATGRPLDVLIREGILDPLGLENTRSEATAEIQQPVLHAFDAERGRYEESTYWDPSWTLARGAIMTSSIADMLTSARALGEGSLLSPQSHGLQLAPETAGFAPWTEQIYYGLGVMVINGWIVQNPSFSGYAATMAYLPSHKLAIAVATTNDEGASEHGSRATDVLKLISAYLEPQAPF